MSETSKQKVKKALRLSSITALLFIISIFTVAVAVIAIELKGERERFVQRVLESEIARARVAETRFLRELRHLRNDVLSLSLTGPDRVLADLEAASDGRDMTPGGGRAQNGDWLADPSVPSAGQASRAKAQLQNIFASFIEGHPYYRQIRLIGLADEGMELVRVDRGRDGDITIVAEEMLQRKGQRDYFQRAIRLPPYQTFLSDIELNKEFGVVEQPQWPTIRSAAPVYDSQGQVFGILIINVDVTEALELLRGVSDRNVVSYLVNDEGSFLIHPERHREFALDLGHGFVWGFQFPEISLADLQANKLQTEGMDGDNPFYSYYKASDDLYLIYHNFILDHGDGSKQLTMMYGVDFSREGLWERLVINRTIAFILAISVVLGALVLLYLRRAFRPLEALEQAAQKIGQGHWEVALPECRHRELQTLTESFAKMVSQMKSHSNIPVMILSVQRTGRVLDINDSVRTMLGYQADELVGADWTDLVAAQDVDRASFHAKAACTNVPIQVLAKNGKVLDVLMSHVIDSSSMAMPEQSLVVLVDISSQREVEAELKQSNARFRRAFESAGHGVALVTIHSEWIDVNERLCDLLGYTRDQMMKKSFSDLIHADDLPNLEAKYIGMLKGHSDTFLHEARFVRLDGGEVPTMVAGGLICTEKGDPEYFVFQITDLTALKMAEAKVLQIQKMEAVGNLTGGIAHDFNNLLGVIIGNLQLLQRRLSDQEKAIQYSTRAIKAAQKGASLTRQLLTFSRNQVSAPEVLDVNEVIRETARILERTLGENIQVMLLLEDSLPAIRVDPVQLESAIINMAINARDAMPKGGEITISTSCSIIDSRYLHHNHGFIHAGLSKEVRPGPHVRISISDMGTGISDADIEKIFDPFFTTKAPGKGTGLGLSMVYGFVQQIGGQISVYSEIGQGTVIAMNIPAELSTASRREQDALNQEPIERQGTILVVEDNAAFREVVAAQLEDFGYSVVVVENAQKAWEALESSSTLPDLVITDVIMPGKMGGKELAERIEAVYPALPILMMSGFPGHSLRELERFTLLNKPYTEADLIMAIDQAMAQATAKGQGGENG